MRKVKEKTIEENNRKWALDRYGDALREKSGRLVVRKMNAYPDRDWPDRMFIGRRVYDEKPILFFIEYKRRGKEPTPNQARLHQAFLLMGVIVKVVDDKEEGREVIRALMEDPL